MNKAPSQWNKLKLPFKLWKNDTANFNKVKEQAVEKIALQAKTLEEKADFYTSLQAEINILNTQAARINSLRKELIKTEMRVRKKNKFFQRLSAAGDKVFPRRKELIQDVSHQFQ